MARPPQSLSQGDDQRILPTLVRQPKQTNSSIHAISNDLKKSRIAWRDSPHFLFHHLHHAGFGIVLSSIRTDYLLSLAAEKSFPSCLFQKVDLS